MQKRIISAFLVFVLIISNVDLNVLAMPIDIDNESPAARGGAVSAEEISGQCDMPAEDGTAKEMREASDTADNAPNDKDESKGSGTESNAPNSEDASKGSGTENNVPDNSGVPENPGTEADTTKDRPEEPNTEGNTPDDNDASGSSGTDPGMDGDAAENDAKEDDAKEDDAKEDDAAEASDSEIDIDEENEDLPLEAEAPSKSTTQSFLTDTQAPYDGDYLLVANVSTDEQGEAETSGTLPAAAAAAYSVEKSGNYIFSTDNPNVYDFDENGMGLIDPASFLPEPVLDEGGIEYQASQESETAEYYIGYEKNFYLNTTSDSQYNSVDCVCVAVSEYCTVWVPAQDPIYAADAEKMKAYMGELAAEFDSQFPKMTEMFGSKETVDRLYGDNDGKTALLCYDINGNGMSGSSYTAGYFFPSDLNIAYTNRTNNNIDCLHIDSWQGMGRSTSNGTLNPIQGKRTMVHELQHMINYSICRNNEPSDQFTKLKIPTYLNEAYSEAAAHLCYGEATNRISSYNTYSYIDEGKLSLFGWKSSPHSISSYALSYLFSQYIRIQYENGDTIYKDTMNGLTMSNDLFSLIADKLGITGEELLLNFRAALFLKNAEGIYGFGGEKWAESIKSKYYSVFSGTSLSLSPGAAAIIRMSDSFEPSDAGSNIRFIGMYKDLTAEDIEVQISGGTSITEDQGELQLAAAVSPKGVSQSVIFSLPNEEDSAYASVSASGLVKAVADGEITVRATSVYNPSKYSDVTITITGQRTDITIEQVRSPELGGIRVSYTVIRPSEAALYYTVNGDTPTFDNERLPEEGLLFDAAGAYTLRILGHDPNGKYMDCYVEDEIVVEGLPLPLIDVETELASLGTQRVIIKAWEGAAVYYTTDSSVPSMENGTKYEEPFIIDTPGTTTIRAVALKEGMAASPVADKEITVSYSYEMMEESGRKPYLTQVSFTLNKKVVEGTRFSILPIMDNEIVDAEFVDNSDNFLLERLQGTNDWDIKLVNRALASKTYQAKIRVISKSVDSIVYSDIINIKITVTEVKPKVSLKPVTVNTAYPAAGYPLSAASASGKVEILGITNGSNAGFTDNFEVKGGVLYLKRPYDEFVKTAANKPVLSGKLQVQVEGYEPQELAFSVKTTNKTPTLAPSLSSIRLNYNKLNEEKSFNFTLDNKTDAKESPRLKDIEKVSLNENGGANYKKAAELVQGVSCSDGQNITVQFKDIKPGAYTLPLLVSAGLGEEGFTNAKCNVKFVIEKENVNPTLKLSTAKVKLNRQTRGEKAYIAVKAATQVNIELTDIQCEYAGMTKLVNIDRNVSLSYNPDTWQLEAKMSGEPACNTYKFVCMPYYNGVAAPDKTMTVTVTVIDKAPAVSLKAKGSIDVLNRDTSAITYSIKKTNFADEIASVEFEKAAKLTQTVLDARDFFNAPVFDKEDSKLTISAKEAAVFTKGKKYAFCLKLTLEGSGRTVMTKDITIKPKQSAVKLTASAKPVFYTYVNTGNNTKAVTLQSNKGIIEKVEWKADANKKIPGGITPIIDEDGQLKGVAFDGDGSIKKGTYKLTFNVYYKGQLWEKATAGKASCAKPAVFRLTISVK